ncbi:MAG: hypothetical protein KAS70_04150 [Planctomycetes bacterium]|nr:hypothetical protein [Planctomycetota bacterium]
MRIVLWFFRFTVIGLLIFAGLNYYLRWNYFQKIVPFVIVFALTYVFVSLLNIILLHQRQFKKTKK